MKWEFEIKDSKCMECQALRANMAYTEISIDRQTLVRGNSSSLIIDLENKFPNYFLHEFLVRMEKEYKYLCFLKIRCLK